MKLARGLVQSWQHSMTQPGSLTQDRVASCAVGVIVFCQRATLFPPLLLSVPQGHGYLDRKDGGALVMGIGGEIGEPPAAPGRVL